MLHGNESVEMDLRRLPITLSRNTGTEVDPILCRSFGPSSIWSHGKDGPRCLFQN